MAEYVKMTKAELIEELRREKKRFSVANSSNRSLIEASLDPLVAIGQDGRITDVNAASEEVTGYCRKELIGTDFCDYFTDSDAAIFGYQQVFKDGFVCDYPLEIRHRDGHTTPVLYSATVCRDEAGNPVGVIAAARDIVERKQLEEELRRAQDELGKSVLEQTGRLEWTAEALRASEERYALAVQGSNDGIWDFNIATGEAYHSPRWKSILGFEGDEIPGNFKEWETRIHPEEYQLVMDRLKAYLDGETPAFEVEHRLLHKDAGYRWILSRGACLRDSQGRPYRMAGSITDITERKKLEQQLLQAQKMESIGILAGGLAHEFNNLLTAVSGFGQIVQETIPEDDELSQESIGQVLKAAERATELTRGLLAFGRKQILSPKPVHIDTLIRNTSRLIQRIIGEDIEFSIDSPGEKLTIKAAPGQIEQVLMNLATNARDAMPFGGSLTITTKQVIIKGGSEGEYDLSVPGRYALISVADTGTGIDKKSVGTIFEPFYTTKEIGMGTGLGLSIIHGIVKQHNGSILVSSEVGKGTTFNIYLPLYEGHVVAEKSKMAEPTAAGTETVLVAEDEDIVRYFIKKILEKAGYRVIVADNGEEAVRRFEEHNDISLVLSDVVMPRKNGREMMDEIRKIKPGVKVLFISGYAENVIRKKGIYEKGTGFIAKPFRKEELLRKVKEVLDKG